MKRKKAVYTKEQKPKSREKLKEYNREIDLKEFNEEEKVKDISNKKTPKMIRSRYK